MGKYTTSHSYFTIFCVHYVIDLNRLISDVLNQLLVSVKESRIITELSSADVETLSTISCKKCYFYRDLILIQVFAESKYVVSPNSF